LPRPSDRGVDEGEAAQIPEPLRQMRRVLDGDALREVARAMRLTLFPTPTPAERRVAELGFLATLLNARTPEPGWSFSRVPRQTYDALRPTTAPRSARLVERYGSWIAACYHASGLQPDGTWTSPHQPWQKISTGARRYELWELLAALQECRRETGRRPSSRLYIRWSAEKRKQARRAGRHGRIPCHTVIYAFFPGGKGGWNAALTDAGVEES